MYSNLKHHIFYNHILRLYKFNDLHPHFPVFSVLSKRYMMMASKLVFIFMLTFTCLMAYSNAARMLPDWNLRLRLRHSFNIKTRAELDEASNTSTNGTLGNCWNTIAEIKSCTNEISAYFKNGAIDIGLPCCQAIKIITQHCWPAMLTALRITPDQTNILVGYCDASVSVIPSPSPVAATGQIYR